MNQRVSLGTSFKRVAPCVVLITMGRDGAACAERSRADPRDIWRRAVLSRHRRVSGGAPERRGTGSSELTRGGAVVTRRKQDPVYGFDELLERYHQLDIRGHRAYLEALADEARAHQLTHRHVDICGERPCSNEVALR